MRVLVTGQRRSPWRSTGSHDAKHKPRSGWPRHCRFKLYEQDWFDSGPLLREEVHEGRGRGPPYGELAQTPCDHSQSAGLRRYQRYGHAQSPRRSRIGRSSVLCLHEHASAFGGALIPPTGAPAVWVTEDVTSVPKNIYGVTKTAAEHLCELFHRDRGLACLILRTSRFFPEEDDCEATRQAYDDYNVKANEYLYRRV